MPVGRDTRRVPGTFANRSFTALLALRFLVKGYQRSHSLCAVCPLPVASPVLMGDPISVIARISIITHRPSGDATLAAAIVAGLVDDRRGMTISVPCGLSHSRSLIISTPSAFIPPHLTTTAAPLRPQKSLVQLNPLKSLAASAPPFWHPRARQFLRH